MERIVRATETDRKGNLFNPTFEQEYELALREGNRRFGSECQHERTKRGRCLKCWRRVLV